MARGTVRRASRLAKEAVEAFLTTNLTDGLPQFADFLEEAYQKVEAIAPNWLSGAVA